MTLLEPKLPLGDEESIPHALETRFSDVARTLSSQGLEMSDALKEKILPFLQRQDSIPDIFMSECAKEGFVNLFTEPPTVLEGKNPDDPLIENSISYSYDKKSLYVGPVKLQDTFMRLLVKLTYYLGIKIIINDKIVMPRINTLKKEDLMPFLKVLSLCNPENIAWRLSLVFDNKTKSYIWDIPKIGESQLMLNWLLIQKVTPEQQKCLKPEFLELRKKSIKDIESLINDKMKVTPGFSGVGLLSFFCTTAHLLRDRFEEQYDKQIWKAFAAPNQIVQMALRHSTKVEESKVNNKIVKKVIRYPLWPFGRFLAKKETHCDRNFAAQCVPYIKETLSSLSHRDKGDFDDASYCTYMLKANSTLINIISTLYESADRIANLPQINKTVLDEVFNYMLPKLREWFIFTESVQVIAEVPKSLENIKPSPLRGKIISKARADEDHQHAIERKARDSTAKIPAVIALAEELYLDKVKIDYNQAKDLYLADIPYEVSKDETCIYFRKVL